MKFLAISGFLNFLTSISLGAFVFWKDPKNELNRTYFLFNLSIALYSFGYFFWQITDDLQIALAWFKILFTGIVLINLLYLRFVFIFLEIFTQKRLIFYFSFLLSFLFIVLNYNDKLYLGLETREGLGLWPLPTFWFDLYLIFWHWTCFYGFYWLIRGRKFFTGLKKQQIHFVSIACGVGYIGGATNWPMWYGINFPPYPNIAISFYVALIAFTILRYRLMDFNLIVRWGIAYASSFMLLGIFFLVFVVFFETTVSMLFKDAKFYPTLIAIAALVFMFDPLRKRTTKVVDHIIFKSPDFQAILSGIRKSLESSITVESITLGLVDQFKKIWNVEHVGFAIWNSDNCIYELLPSEVFRDQIITSTKGVIDKRDFLVKTLESERRLFKYGIVSDVDLISLTGKASLGEKATFGKIRRTLRWIGAATVVPLMLNTELIGFIILGNKKNNSIYNEEDKKFLSHVSEMVSDTIRHIILSQPVNLTHLQNSGIKS